MDKLAVAVGLLGLAATLAVLVLHAERSAFEQRPVVFRRLRASTWRAAVALGLATAGFVATRLARHPGSRARVLALFGAMAFGVASATLADLVRGEPATASRATRARLAVALGTVGRAVALLLALALVALTLEGDGLARLPAVLAAFVLGAALVAVLGVTQAPFGAETLAATVVSAAVAAKNEAALRALGVDPLGVALLPVVVQALASLAGLAVAMAITEGPDDEPGDAESRGLVVTLLLVVLGVVAVCGWWLRVPAWGFVAIAGTLGVLAAWGTLIAFRYYQSTGYRPTRDVVAAKGRERFLAALTVGLEAAMVVTGLGTFVLVAAHACGDALPLARGGNLGAATAVAALAGTRAFVEGAPPGDAADERPAAHGLVLGGLSAFLLLESAGELELASDAAFDGALGAAIVGALVVAAWAALRVRAQFTAALVLAVPLAVTLALKGRGEPLLVMAMVATVVGVAISSVLFRLATPDEPRRPGLFAAATQLPHLVLALAALPARRCRC
ncbi:MAG: hypothetical protein IPJ34_00515 [Myxococcales bacterium]|nr:hypothetical protein [Myxococcales bacterium]